MLRLETASTRIWYGIFSTWQSAGQVVYRVQASKGVHLHAVYLEGDIADEFLDSM